MGTSDPVAAESSASETASATSAETDRRPIVFVSYSRSEANLVEDLGKRLNDRKLTPWIDYQSMEVGDDWDKQLTKAVAAADVVLLVVSRRAAASINVRSEWADAKDGGKPIVLAIAEAVEIEEPYASRPWVDVRTRRASAIDRVCDLVAEAHAANVAGRTLPKADPPAPGAGFRAPFRVWLGFLASIGVAASSLAAFWTVILPIVLVPLPYRILRRSFNYVDVRNALLALPMAIYITLVAVTRSDDGNHGLVDAAGVLSFLCAPTLYFAMRGGSFRRWVEPAAARPRRLVRRVVAAERTPKSVPYRIDAVAEDETYADRLVSALTNAGHVRVEDDNDTAEDTSAPVVAGGDDDPAGEEETRPLVLRFVSQFHDVTDVGPLDRTIPILVADPDDRMPPKLRRRQWIDLRRGVDQARLELIARHLDEPKEILRQIGSPPPHRQRVLPKGVQGLFVTAWASVGAIVGYWFLLIVGLRSEFSVIGTSAVVTSASLSIATLAGMLWLTRKLRTRRRGRLRASLVPILTALTLAISFPMDDRIAAVETTAEQQTAIANAPFGLVVVAVALLIFWLFHGVAVRRWIPSRSMDTTADGSGRAGSTGASWRDRRRRVASVGS